MAPLPVADVATDASAAVTHVIREESVLEGVDYAQWLAAPTTIATRFVSTLTASLPDGSTKTYTESVAGYLIPKATPPADDCFGWDHHFHPAFSVHSFYELKRMGLKTSPRDAVVSKFCMDTLYYRKPVVWKHHPLVAGQV